MSPIRMNSQTASVKVIVTMDDGEVVTYDVAKVEEFSTDTEYAYSERLSDPRPPRVESVSFSMRPIPVDGVSLTISRSESDTPEH